MKRRELVTALVAVAVTRPLPAQAQTPPAVIGFLSGTSPVRYAPFLAAFKEGLTEAGFNEGQNVSIEYRWANGDFGRLPEMAEDLVRRRVDVIVTSGSTLAAMAAKDATATIPTVFIAGDDPVANHLVASLAHPGGNRTGINFLVAELNPKRFELLCELVPGARNLGLLVNPNNPAATNRTVGEVTAAARQKSVTLTVLRATTEAEIDAACEAFAGQRIDALMIGNDAFFNSQRERFVALTSRQRLPAIYESHEAVSAGGLISYGPSFPAMYRQLGLYAAKLLKGAKPAELPVMQPTKFELAVNVKTAKTLGLSVPPLLLAQADEVIE